jgi:hypothetical protein
MSVNKTRGGQMTLKPMFFASMLHPSRAAFFLPRRHKTAGERLHKTAMLPKLEQGQVSSHE